MVLDQDPSVGAEFVEGGGVELAAGLAAEREGAHVDRAIEADRRQSPQKLVGAV
jgi:hypothetical protein